MFYSREVLTSKKFGVATVWLVATLGSKSSTKKVSRKAILDVDVPKTCETIITPEAPLALRLQGNLLFGVSRVYQQQCSYVLQDAQNAQNSMKTIVTMIRASEIDLPQDQAPARPEQLLLQDDPSFMPGFTFPPLSFDATLLNASFPPSSDLSSALSSRTARTSPPSPRDIPVSIVSISESTWPVAVETSATRANNPRSDLVEEEDLPLGADFTFDAEGNMIDLSDVAISHQQEISSRASQGQSHIPRGENLTSTSGKNKAALRIGVNVPTFVEGLGISEYSDAVPIDSSASIYVESSPPLVAPQRRRRPRKALLRDSETELGNSDLQGWSNNYLRNMVEAAHGKVKPKQLATAKRNAEYWVFGAGFGNMIKPPALRPGNSNLHNPIFNISYKSVTGNELHSHSLKRDYSAIDGEKEDLTRQVRRRVESGDEGRHVPESGVADDFDLGAGLVQDGQIDVGHHDEVELPRQGGTPLADNSSLMPWNTTASLRGSSIARAGSIIGSASGAFPGSRRGSRLVSASPLHSRAPLLTIPGEEPPSGLSDGLEDFGMHHEEDVMSQIFELHGPTVDDDIWTAGESRLQRTTLDVESNNFLSFIRTAIRNKNENNADTQSHARCVSFNDLLRPESNSRAVASQGFLHVLSLVTKNVLVAEQEDAFRDIFLTPANRSTLPV